MRNRDALIDVLLGSALALAVVALLLFGASGPKFIYVDF